jgi:hypothetical protein
MYFCVPESFVAGNTTDYVNDIIAKVEDGDLTGGLPNSRYRPKPIDT